jgi:hypothetical protein
MFSLQLYNFYHLVVLLFYRFVMSQKLKRASQFTFGELNLRQYFFDKWRHFKNISVATETIDVALLVWAMRDAMNEWKSLAWPRQYKSRRDLRVFKRGFFGQSPSTLIENDDEGDEELYVDKKHEYKWPQQEYFGNPVTPEVNRHHPNQDDEEDDDIHALGAAGTGQEQQKWQMAALMDEGSAGAGDEKSTASKRSWFTFSSLRSRR